MKVENREKNLVDITNEYYANKRPPDESETILDETVDKVKTGPKAGINGVKNIERYRSKYKKNQSSFPSVS